jgi:predicted DNA-binding transcriptional regulator AlpA
MTDTLLTPAEVAKLIRRPETWLAKLRMTGDGPRFLKVGGKVRYRRSALEAWLADCERASTGA